MRKKGKRTLKRAGSGQTPSGERENRGGKNGGPEVRPTERCPDCELRNALGGWQGGAHGLPLPRYRQGLGKPSRRLPWAGNLSSECENCGGPGRVPR